MGVQELGNEKFKHGLLKLTENDITRAEKLAFKPAYHEIMQELLRRGAKMEQEAIERSIWSAAASPF